MGVHLTSNLSVSGGQLHIKSQQVTPFTVSGHTYNYTTAMINTGRGAQWYTWLSDYFEVRARLPQGAGHWPAF